MRIGVLALQGAFREHIEKINSCGAEGVEIRLPEQLDSISGLIIPGGESTAIGKLLNLYNFTDKLRSFNKPIWGTCAGMIILANEIKSEDPWLSLIDIEVQRNAFGRQLDSFTTILNCKYIGDLEAVFIRAPIITKLGENVEVIAKLEDGTPVAARQNKILVTSFHPELGKSNSLHKWFIEQVNN